MIVISNCIVRSKVKSLFVAFAVTMLFSCAAVASGVLPSQGHSMSSAQVVQTLERQASIDGITLRNISIHKEEGGGAHTNAVQGCTVSATIGVPPLTITVSVTADTCAEAASQLALTLARLAAVIGGL